MFTLNVLTGLINTPYLAIWDTDVVLPKIQIIDSVEILRSLKYHFVLPYDGRFYNLPSIITNLYKSNRDIKFLTQNIGKFPLMFGKHSVGGAIIVNKYFYVQAGMENENLYGWGPEDAERIKRWEILGYKIKRIKGPLFHLYHPRNENSWYYNSNTKKDLLKEYLKICSFSSCELKNYVNTFQKTANDR